MKRGAFTVGDGQAALAIGAPVIVVLKVLAVAGYDLTTAFAILKESGPADVVFGVALALAPAAAITLATVASFVLVARRGARMPVALGWLGSSLVGVAIAVPSRNYTVAGAALVGALMVGAAVRAMASPAVGGSLTPLSIIGVVAVSALAVTTSQPWLPLEVIVSKDGSYTPGYVLSESPTWLTVLTDDPRIVVRQSPSGVTEREICSLATHRRDRTLVQRLTGHVQYSNYFPLCRNPLMGVGVAVVNKTRPDGYSHSAASVESALHAKRGDRVDLRVTTFNEGLVPLRHALLSATIPPQEELISDPSRRELANVSIFSRHGKPTEKQLVRRGGSWTFTLPLRVSGGAAIGTTIENRACVRISSDVRCGSSFLYVEA